MGRWGLIGELGKGMTEPVDAYKKRQAFPRMMRAVRKQREREEPAMSVTNYAFDLPTRVLFGPGSLGKLRSEKLPGNKALVCISAGGSMRRHGQLDALLVELDAAGVTYAVYEGVTANPTMQDVDAGARMAEAEGCDFVIGMGGGSTMDAAKVIALVAANGGSCWDYCGSETGGKQKPAKDALPIVAITTSAGTGSEVDPWAVISREDTGEKNGMGWPSTFPVLAIVDADLMMSVPPKFTAWQGMDAFYHAAESVICKSEHALGEMFALKAIELIAKALPRAVADGSDREARADMALASTLAGVYMLCTSEHRMEHSMGGLFPKLPHGAGLIMVSHAYFDFFAEREACEAEMVKMAKAMGVADATSGKDFIAALDALIEAVGCKDLAMSEWGITRDDLPRFVDNYHRVRGGDINGDPIHLTDDDLLDMYEASFK